MGRRSYAAVVRAFHAEAEAAFRGLTDEFSFAFSYSLVGPERDDFMMPSVAYQGPSYRCVVLLDTQEMRVAT